MKRQIIKTDPKLAYRVELVKNIKSAIISEFHMFQKTTWKTESVKQRHGRYKKKTQRELLQLKTKIFQMKKMQDMLIEVTQHETQK